jgi:SAM-dependent methyltransferase
VANADRRATDARTAGVRAFFGRTSGYGAYLEKRFGVEVRARIVRGMLGDVVNSTMLDIGCGDGTLSLQYAGNGNHLTLIDVSSEMLETARRNTPQALQGDVEYLNIDFGDYAPNRSFDVILCVGVLAHFESAELLIGRLSSALKPGGRCLVQLTDPASVVARINSLYDRALGAVCGNKYHYPLLRVSLTDMRRLCARNGLTVVGQRRYSLLLPGMGRLPDRFLGRYQLRTLDSRLLSRHGSEVILLLRRT